MNYELYSLFPKLVYKNILDDITDEELLEIKKYLNNIKYRKTDKYKNALESTSSSQNNFIFKNKELFFFLVSYFTKY